MVPFLRQTTQMESESRLLPATHDAHVLKKHKAGGRMLRPGRTLLTKSDRRGGREGASQLRKRFFCYDMQFKHDLPHDEESIKKKCGQKICACGSLAH